MIGNRFVAAGALVVLNALGACSLEHRRKPNVVAFASLGSLFGDGRIKSSVSKHNLKVRSCNPALSRITCSRESDSLPYEKGYGRKRSNGYPEEHLAGVWNLEFRTGDALQKTTSKEFGKFSLVEATSRTVALNSDGSCTNPKQDEKWVLKDLHGRERLKGYWRVEGDEVTVTIQTRSTTAGKTILRFQGKILESSPGPYGSLVKGNVLDGEESPEWAGYFMMKQLIGGAAMGMGPAGRPAILAASRASLGFDLAGRSSAEVLRRFAGEWDGALSLSFDDDMRISSALRLFPNGTFVSTSLTRVGNGGVSSAGVLRGRWNVYYSDAHGRDRVWLQVLRLQSSGVGLSQDWLLLGDLALDTFDLEALLRIQIMEAEKARADPLAAAAAAAAESYAGPQDMDSAPAAKVWEEEDDEVLVQRGLFSRGRPRRYRARGDVLVGVSHLPEVVGSFVLVQRAAAAVDAGEAVGEGGGASSPSETPASGGGADWTEDVGLGGGDEL